MSQKYYLRESVYVEPLVNNWYAWPNLLSPFQYALYMNKTHLRLMKSFANNHELHIMANENKTIAGGGEFVDCKAEQLEDVKSLINKFETDDALFGELADALKSLNAMLKQHVSGESLEPLYKQVPDLLKGYVELVMDSNHNPSFRVIEGLVYQSEYYRKDLQSVSLGVLNEEMERPFVLSTPRLPDTDHIHIREPFDSEFWDTLFKTRTQPISKQEIEALFEGKQCTGGLNIFELFTTEAPAGSAQEIEATSVKYIGHAGLLLQTQNVSILVDPVVANITSKNREQAIGFAQLPEKIDYICLTHNHSDHVNLETLLQLRHKTSRILVPKNNGGSLLDPSLKMILRQLKFDVIEIDDLEVIDVPDGSITGIPFLGEHGDLNIRSKTGWLFQLNGKKIYAGADSSNLEPIMYEKLSAYFGELDLMAIGMECVGAPFTWLYGALFTEAVPRNIKESRRLNGSSFETASQITNALKPKNVWIYALGLEPWYNYFMGLDYSDDSEQIVQSMQMVEFCQAQGIPVERLCGKSEIKF
ncbi:MBL fold metallo-hydrolase [Pseudoalteromonas luteoviolacea]|uniref:MBL fold metallo-hydrolase n=1 Tax=Pseudoalteromonas luteoviolacea TaxID=43657 RepID=UPI001B38E9D6|nr:MBL fold metallo-hydrolase [Pseudoalteromonas luteoviolacea]MBQ4836004.1 MBL fold metallo-hydrolase [Pseudoalteromonas luteoviolacea]